VRIIEIEFEIQLYSDKIKKTYVHNYKQETRFYGIQHKNQSMLLAFWKYRFQH
jgi:hypothetical protein